MEDFSGGTRSISDPPDRDEKRNEEPWSATWFER